MLQDYHIINQLYLTEIYHSDRFHPDIVKLRSSGFLQNASPVLKIKVATAMFVQKVIDDTGEFLQPNGEKADIKQMATDLNNVKSNEDMSKFWSDYGLFYYTGQEDPYVIEPI
jgi:hypothetical protein